MYTAPPKGYGTVTPYLIIDGCAKAIEFYCKLFNAKENMRFDMEGGKVAHAEIQIGDCRIMLGDENVEEGLKSPLKLGGVSAGVHLYVKDVDMLYARAVEAGAKSLKEPKDQFWGDRNATVVDPFGHRWSFAAQKEALTTEEMHKRMENLSKP